MVTQISGPTVITPSLKHRTAVADDIGFGHIIWKTVPDYYLGKYGGLRFLLRCNYDIKYIEGLPMFYKDILKYFNDLKTLYCYEKGQDMVIFNNKEILVGGKPVFISEWFNSNILLIQDLLNNNGQFLTYQEFGSKYPCKTNFLQFYQVITAIPKHLVTKAKNTETPEGELYTEDNLLFELDDSTQIHLGKTKTSDFYRLQYRSKVS